MIGLIGFGRFGRLAAKYLATGNDVFVFDINENQDAAKKIDVTFADFQTVCSQKILVLAVPISAMKNTLYTVRSLLAENTIVVDVCSVKECTVQWMSEILPEGTQILGTHPMFGPDSAAHSLEGQQIILCNHSVKPGAYAKIKSFLLSYKLRVLELTPEEHDQQSAYSLNLTHFIGRSLSRIQARDLTVDTEGYRRLLHILDVVENDTWQLFIEMNRYNNHAKNVRARFVEAAKAIDGELS